MKILDNSSAMDVLFEIGQYAENERKKLKELHDIVRNRTVVDIRLIKLVKKLDDVFFHMWYVENLRQHAMNYNGYVPDALNTRTDEYMNGLMHCIDRDFTEASLIAGIV